MTEAPTEGPREGESLHEWIERRRAEMMVEAAKEPSAYLHELAEWTNAHPDSTLGERDVAFEQIKQKYPRMVEYDRKSKLWEAWKDKHEFATLSEKEAGYFEVWGVEDDETDWEEDPEFWEYDPDDSDDARNAR